LLSRTPEMTLQLTSYAHSQVDGPPIASRTAKVDRLPSLDGLRAKSIVLILLGHLSGTRGFVRVDLGIGDSAHLGVVVSL